MAQTPEPQNGLNGTRKMEKKPIKKIVTLITHSGKIYQKIKINNARMTYEDLLRFVKKPFIESKNPRNYQSQLEKTILSTIEGNPINNKDTVKSGKIRVCFKVRKILKVFNHFLKFEKFPEDLNELHIGCSAYQHKLPDFPENLDTLRFDSTTYPITDLPESLKTLVIGAQYSFTLPNLPKNLRFLEVGYGYKYSRSVPRSTQTLKVEFF